MTVRGALRSVARWGRRVRARRRARLEALRPVDEQLVEFSQRVRRNGGDYDTWRHTLPVPRRQGPGI